jgi:hypothetical protein
MSQGYFWVSRDLMGLAGAVSQWLPHRNIGLTWRRNFTGFRNSERKDFKALSLGSREGYCGH